MLRHLITALMVAAVLAAGLGVAARDVAQAQEQAKPADPVPAPAKNDYGKFESWLCRPGRNDACAIDLTTTIVAANGKLTRETWSADALAS